MAETKDLVPTNPEVKSVTKHPGGRLPKALSESHKVKEQYLRAFMLAGGLDRLVSLLRSHKLAKNATDESKAKAALADSRFLEFVKMLIKLLPQQTEHEETRTVIFRYADGTEEDFEAKTKEPAALDAEIVK
jgi:hypothetical protein